MKNNQKSFFVSTILGMMVLGIVLPAHTIGATAPRVTTLPPTNGTATTAAVRGTANPGGATTTAWFEWGPGNAFKFSTATTNVGSGASTLPFGLSITGLVPGIAYKCRAVASNSLGVVRGMAVPFGSPQVTLNGATTQTNNLSEPYADPGATATNPPLAIAVGDSYTLALKADGRIAAWGINTEGQATIPNDGTNVVAMAAGYVHSLALRLDGTVFGWGTNEFDQLSIPPDATNVMEVAAGFAHSLALRSNGTIASWGSDDLGQVTVHGEATNVVAIAAGYTHSLALRADGHVVAWGEYPSTDTIDAPLQASNVVAIAAGYSHSLALRANGTVVAWGDSSADATTVPATATNVVAVAAGYSHSLALRADGTIVGWGSTNYGEINIPSAATNVIAIGAGFAHSQALRADGTVIGWGFADSGRTITPAGLTTNLPVAVAGSVNTSVVGTYPLLYSATNVFGLVGTATRSVLVVGSAPIISTRAMLGNGSFQLGLDYTPGSTITVLTSTNISLPATNWTVLGQATENSAGHYQFTDSTATSYPQRFYRVRTP